MKKAPASILCVAIQSLQQATRIAAYILCVAILSLHPLTSGAQTVALKTDGLDAQYVETITKRAQKIVDGLNIGDADKALSVRNIIANRYFLLNQIHEQNKGNADKRDAELYKHHFELAADLSVYVDEATIEAVKDGMTYGVVPKTYQAHLDMIPSLKPEEKAQILAWLKEAREFAMDAENSDKKHGWFGKYKGRINNWLSKRGYDLVKEREGWYKRIEEAKKK